MKHLIIGAGTVGYATGVWLEANKENVHYFDIKEEVILKLNKEKKKVTQSLTGDYAMYWICTAEWNAESVLKVLEPRDGMVIVRSTTPPGTVEKWGEEYRIDKLYHVPEFLKQNTALEDIFHPDRVIIGITKVDAERLLYLFEGFLPGVPIIITKSTMSETIKLLSNAWLSTQISFWNEAKRLCDELGVNPQLVAEACTLDKRISKYGSKMLGTPFKGVCLPKDLVSLKKAFKEIGLESHLFDGVSKANECR